MRSSAVFRILNISGNDLYCSGKNRWRQLVKPLNIIISRVGYIGWVISSVFSTAHLFVGWAAVCWVQLQSKEDSSHSQFFTLWYSLHLEQFLNSLPPSFGQLRLKVLDLFSPGNWYLGIGKNVRLCDRDSEQTLGWLWTKFWTKGSLARVSAEFVNGPNALNVSKLRPFNY